MVDIDWVKIPRGKFQMGISEKQLTSLYERMGSPEPPEQRTWSDRVVDLDTFYISRFPVTCRQCDAFFGAYPRLARWRMRRREEPPDMPEEVNWYIADLFCHWIGGQLPTAAEWEKAARGTDGRLYPWGNEWDPTRGNFTEDEDAPPLPEGARGRKTPVDAYPTGVSPYGVYDMVGNLREWTRSLGPFANREGIIVKAMSVKDATYPSWLCHMAARLKVWGDLGGEYIGFRPVKDEWQKEYWQGFQVGQQSGK